jgi:hypothetical protein
MLSGSSCIWTRDTVDAPKQIPKDFIGSAIDNFSTPLKQIFYCLVAPDAQLLICRVFGVFISIFQIVCNANLAVLLPR